jgi:hypothetical protein
VKQPCSSKAPGLDNHANLKKMIFDYYSAEFNGLKDMTMIIFTCDEKTMVKLVPSECSLVPVGSARCAPSLLSTATPPPPSTPVARSAMVALPPHDVGALLIVRDISDVPSDLLKAPSSVVKADIVEGGTWALLHSKEAAGHYVGVGYYAPYSAVCMYFFKFRVALEAAGKGVSAEARSMLSFHCADYAWMCVLCGAQGASSKRPCIWCHARDTEEIQKGSWASVFATSPHECRPRSIEGMHADAARFLLTKGTAAHAQACNSITASPLLIACAWNIDNLVPPILHLFLGPACKAWDLLIGLVRALVDKHDASSLQLLIDIGEINDYIKGVETDLKSAHTEIKSKKTVVAHFETEQRRYLEGDGRVAALPSGKIPVARLDISETRAAVEYGVTSVDYKKAAECGRQKKVTSAEVVVATARATKMQTELESYAEKIAKLNSQLPPIGRAEKALEDFLQTIKVQRQAYFGGAFVGNHVEKLLKSLDLLWLALRKVAHEMDTEMNAEEDAEPTTETTDAVEGIIRRVSPFWTQLEIFHHECRKTRLLSDVEVERLCSAAVSMVDSAREAYPDTHVELKLHLIEAHVPGFVRKWRSAGLFLEDGVEHYHALDNRMTRRFSCLHGERKARSKQSAVELLQRPDIIASSANRTERRRRNFFTPRTTGITRPQTI